MRSTALLPMVAMLASIYGCSSKAATDNGGNNNDTACSLTLSGAITATLPCTASGNYSLVTVGRSGMAIGVTGGSPGFVLDIGKDGQLSSGTFTQASAGVEQAFTTVSNNNMFWTQTITDPVHGSFSVTLSSVSLDSGGSTYTIHGTFDATLPADAATSATGTVTVHATF